MANSVADQAVFQGRFRLDRSLGRGPSGVVYAATDLMTGQKAALKRIHALYYEESVLRLVQEDARAAGRLGHPGIVAPWDSALDDEGGLYLASDLCGESLRVRLSRGPLSLSTTLEIFGSLCGALDEAHKAGVPHGDLHPGNIFLSEQGTARVADFGMARLQRADGALWSGSGAYTPPEVYRGEAEAASNAADVFALGAMFYECLSGRRLFDGRSAAAVMYKVCVSPLPVLGAALPQDRPRLAAVLAMACEKNPATRFASPQAFWRALLAVVGEGPRAPLETPAEGPHRKAPERIPAPVLAALPRTPPEMPKVAAPPPEEEAPKPLPPSAISNLSTDELPVEPVVEQALPLGQDDVLILDEGIMPPRPVPRPSLKKSLLFGLAGAGVALVGVTIFGVATTKEQRPLQAPAATAVVADKGEGSKHEPAPSEPGDPSALLAAAEGRMAALDYAGALGLSERMQRLWPGDPKIKALHDRAALGLRSLTLYQDLLRALERGDTSAALSLYRELPAGSPLRNQAATALAPQREQFIRLHQELAVSALRNSDCEEVSRQAELLQEVASTGPADDLTERAKRLVSRCKGRKQQPSSQSALKNPFR